MTQTSPSSIEPVRKLEVKEAAELARFYRVPQTLMNMYMVQFGDTVYPKESFLLVLGHRRGIQRIEVDKPHQDNGEWKTEARIYPAVTASIIEAIAKLTETERREAWAYLTAPVREWGRASIKNVRMSTMHEWLDAIAIKRAVCRALRLFVGFGCTSFEELPDVVVESKDLEESRGRVVHDNIVKTPTTIEPKTVETIQSPESGSTIVEWHVPVTRGVASPEGIRQEPIFFKLASVGLCNIDEQHSEVCFIPDRPVKSDSPPISSFLRSRILDAMKQKHAEDFDYSIERNDDGTLRAVLVRTTIDPTRMKELMDSIG